MAPGVGPEHRLRSWALTVLVLAVAIWVSARLIVAAAPVLCVAGAVAAVLYLAWFFARRRRW